MINLISRKTCFFFSSSSICRCFWANVWTLTHGLLLKSCVLENTETLEKQHFRKLICQVNLILRKTVFFCFTSICRCFWATARMLKHRLLSKSCTKKNTRTLETHIPRKLICMITLILRKLNFSSLSRTCRCVCATTRVLKHRLMSESCNSENTG